MQTPSLVCDSQAVLQGSQTFCYFIDALHTHKKKILKTLRYFQTIAPDH